MKWLVRVVSLLLVWGLLVLFVVGVDPRTVRDVGVVGSYLPFWILVLLVLWYTLGLLTSRWLYGLLVAVTVVVGLILSMLQVMHIGLLLALGLTLIIESWYIYRKR